MRTLVCKCVPKKKEIDSGFFAREKEDRTIFYHYKCATKEQKKEMDKSFANWRNWKMRVLLD